MLYETCNVCGKQFSATSIFGLRVKRIFHKFMFISCYLHLYNKFYLELVNEDSKYVKLIKINPLGKYYNQYDFVPIFWRHKENHMPYQCKICKTKSNTVIDIVKHIKVKHMRQN